MGGKIKKLINKLNELYREAQLVQIGADETKSNVAAERVMKIGLAYFCTRSFEDARRFYTLCLAYAEEDSELIGHAYANRSAALFKLGYFEQCLLDIDRALNSNYPEDKKKSLHERKVKASKKVEQSPPLASSRTKEVEAEWRDKLCNFHNPHIPGASNKIQLESNEEWGRHLIATEDINAGEILTCQKFFTMVKAHDSDPVCSYCLLYHPALIPCPTCVLAMYCSEHCRTEAFNSYHRIECRIFQIKDVLANNSIGGIIEFVALRCLLIGTGQGAGLASLMKKISLKDIVDLEANIEKFTEKPFWSDYMFLLRLCRKFHIPLADKVDVIPKMIIVLQKAGYFDSVSDHLQHEADVDPKADGINNSKSERDDDRNETAKDICSNKALDSVEVDDESVDKEEDPDVGKNEDRPIVQEHEDSSRIVGKEFINKVTCHYCELCDLCLCYNPEISRDEIILAHCHTPLLRERCSAKNSEEQDVTTHQERVTGKSRIKKVRRGTKAKKPPKGKRGRKKTNKARLNSTSSRSDDVNEQEKFKHEAHLNEKYWKKNESVYENGDISSKVLDSFEVVDESVDKEGDFDVGKNEDRPIVQELEYYSRIVDGLKLAISLATVILESNDKKEDPDGSENEDRPQEHEDSAGVKFIKEVPGYYCELCNLCLCYKQEMSEDEALLAHCSTPLHLERSSFKTTEEKLETYVDPKADGINNSKSERDGDCHKTYKDATSEVLDSVKPAIETNVKKEHPDEGENEDRPIVKEHADSSIMVGAWSRNADEQDVTTQEGVTEASLLKDVTLDMTAEEPSSDSTASQPKSGTETTAPPLDSHLPASSDANEQILVKRQTYLTEIELYASFLLLNHSLSIDNASFALRQGSDLKSSGRLYGCGVCNLHAMLNHSCDPNVDFISRGQEMALYAIKPISKGEQLFISYNLYSFAYIPLQERQECMKSYPHSKFQFNCECVACVNKWPRYADLLKIPAKFLFSNNVAAMHKEINKITSPVIRKTADSTSRLEIIRAIRRLCEWVFTNVEMPSYIYAECEQLLIVAMNHLYDTSSPIKFTEHLKKKALRDRLLKIVRRTLMVQVRG